MERESDLETFMQEAEDGMHPQTQKHTIRYECEIYELHQEDIINVQMKLVQKSGMDEHDLKVVQMESGRDEGDGKNR